MSTVNVWTSTGRALIGVDTIARDPDGTEHEASKMLVLPHANAVLTGRGAQFLLVLLFKILNNARGDFDGINGQMLEAIGLAYAFCISPEAAQSGLPRELIVGGQEIVLVGWSRQLDRMIAQRYEKAPGAAGFTPLPLTDWFLTPWDDAVGNAEAPDTPAAMERLVRAQVEFYRPRMPEAGFGGRLLLAALTRDTLNVTSHCELGGNDGAGGATLRGNFGGKV